MRVADVARQKPRTGIVAVRFQRELQKRRKRDPVTVLDRVDVAVFQRIDDGGRNERPVARRRAHPQDVVVAPLNVDRVIGKQPVHDDMRAGTAVEDVAHDVQAIDDEPLDEVRKRHDQRIRLFGLDDRADDLVIIADLVLGLDRVQELVDDVGVAFGQRFPDLRPRVFRCGKPADLHHAAKRDLVPFGVHDARALQKVQLLHRVVDQRRKRVALRLGHRVFKQDIDLFADHAGRVLQHMDERLVFAVNVADEMLRALRKTQNRLQIDDLRGDLRDRRVLVRQKLQILHVRELFHAVSAFH